MYSSEIIMIWGIYKPKVATYIYKRVKMKPDADDLLQEVFIKLWTNNHVIKDKSKLLNWLYGISRYTVADYFRQKKNIGCLEIADDIGINPIDPPTQLSDESKKLIPIINSLPVKYKNILYLSEICSMQHKEIAAQFDLSISCVKTRVLRAKKLLAERMHECCTFSYDKYGNIVQCVEKQQYFDCIKNNTEKMPPFVFDYDIVRKQK
jgi:RNA polymerase sigma-70 factor, ECF subfamily